MPVKAAYDYLNEVELIKGTYLDTAQALPHLLAHTEARMRSIAAERGEAEPSTETMIAYNVEIPGQQWSKAMHAVSIDVFRTRNAFDGENMIRLGSYCLVMIYGLWEVRYRAAIASELGISREDLRVPVMGDLRRARHAILHRQGRMHPDTAELEVLDLVDSDGIVRVTEARFWHLAERVRVFVDECDQLRPPTSDSSDNTNA